ncbi:WSSV399 [White spot syndrome virus]|uniref:WSSV399 n=1 Tax=White spot syndrome virus TaxID=342409 RepID=A0A2I6SCA7_9VIRU|nr:WSSV399 [White spot syndrome virus]
MMLMDKAEDADEIRCGLIPLGRGFKERLSSLWTQLSLVPATTY